MVAWSIPQILFTGWFWLTIVVCLLMGLHFVRKRYPRSSPGSREPLGKRRKVIKVIVAAMDVLLIGTVLAGCMVLLSEFHEDFRNWHDPSQLQAIRGVSLLSLFIDIIIWSGVLNPLIGLLSFFQSNLTRLKRVILLILCLLPALFTVPALLTSRVEDRRLILQLGVIFSVPGWIGNGPGVLLGQPVFNVVWWIMRKLHLVSGDVPD